MIFIWTEDSGKCTFGETRPHYKRNSAPVEAPISTHPLCRGQSLTSSIPSTLTPPCNVGDADQASSDAIRTCRSSVNARGVLEFRERHVFRVGDPLREGDEGKVGFIADATEEGGDGGGDVQ